jgi:hypothetical protein
MQLDLLQQLEDRRKQTAAMLADWEARASKNTSPATADRIVNLRRKLALEDANSEYYLEQMIKASRSKVQTPQ